MTSQGQAHPPQAPPSGLAETARFARGSASPLLVSIALGAGAVLAGIGLLGTAAWLITRASQHPQESALALGIVAVQFFGLSRGLFRYSHRLTGHDAALRALRDLRIRVYDRLEEVLPGGAPWLLSGDLMSRFVSDVESVQDLLVGVISPFAIAVIVGSATVAVVWSMLSKAGLILAAALILAGTALPWSTARLAARREARHAHARSELTAAVVDLIQGAPELIVYDAAESRLSRIGGIDAELAEIDRRSARTAGLGQGFAVLLPALAMAGSLTVGIISVRAGRLNELLLAVIAVIPLAAFELTTGLPAATQSLRRIRQSLGRTHEVLQAAPAVSDPQHPRSLPSQPLAVRVRGLRCRYADGGPWALDGLDLDLQPGERIAVLGRSGAGKSTLAHVLARFIPYQEGLVSLGGIELSRLRGDDCRAAIGLLTQDAHVFDTSLRANLRIARPDASDDQLRRALGQVRLLEWSEMLPGGLGAGLGEFGSRMSGGQRQRLSAARAILAEFPVLILDEPGEHVDVETGDAIVEGLLAGPGGQAILLITHRLAGLQAVDEVIVLEAGRILERGTHAGLLAARGVYAEMWQREMSI